MERPAAQVVAPEPAKVAPRRRVGPWAWTALGGLAIAAVAVIFRPDGAEVSVAGVAPAPMARTSESVEPEIAAVTPAAEAPRVLADPALAAVSVVRLRLGPTLRRSGRRRSWRR